MALDVLRSAGYANPHSAEASVACIDGAQLGYAVLPNTLGHKRRCIVISLDGAADLLTRSRKPLAPVVLAWLHSLLKTS